MPAQTIAELIRETRGSRPLAEFAKLIGCSTAGLYKWEQGSIPSAAWCVRIAAVTGRSVEDVLALLPPAVDLDPKASLRAS